MISLRRFVGSLALALAATIAMPAPVAIAQDRNPPYWASIDSSRAIMRRGPSQQMRAMWEYRRPGLPVRVLELHEDWRKIEEPDGTIGWMHRRLLTARRTAIVTGGVQPIRSAARNDANVAWRAAPGVIGALGECRDGWCAFDAGRGRRGFIAADAIWGDGDP